MSFNASKPLLSGTNRPTMRIRLFLGLLAGSIRAQNVANGQLAEPGSNAGFISRINQKGFDLMAGYLGDRVKRFLGVGELVFNISAPVSSDMQITLSSLRVTEFDSQAFTSKMIVIPGKGIAWRVRTCIFLSTSVFFRFLSRILFLTLLTPCTVTLIDATYSERKGAALN
ncbi:hypothetical protein COOONC_28549 [Cooperia oncophora]